MAERTCWVCLVSDTERASDQDWVSPCRCSGTLGWVHHSCLKRWVNDSNGNVDKTKCPQCRTPYVVKEPPKGLVLLVGDAYNEAVNATAPILGSFIGVSALWGLLSLYGYVTVIHVAGPKGKLVLERAPAWRLALLLPAIPLGLLSLRLRLPPSLSHNRGHLNNNNNGRNSNNNDDNAIDDDDDGFQRYRPEDYDSYNDETSSEFEDSSDPGDSSNNDGDDSDDSDGYDDYDEYEDEEEFRLPEILPRSTPSRIICGGLAFPYVAAAVGKGLTFVFGDMDMEQFEQTLIGGCLYYWTKLLLERLYSQQKRHHLEGRRIMDYYPA